MPNYGDKCHYDQDCSQNLICDLDQDRLFQPQRICTCANSLVWIEGHCQGQQQNIKWAEIITILIPVLSSVIFTLIVILVCCCWIHHSTVRLRQDTKKATAKAAANKYEEFELDKEVPQNPECQIAVDATADEAKVTKAQVKVEDKALVPYPDPAYQSNMRFLLQRPKSPHVDYSRPYSANFFNMDSRPSSAFAGLQSRSSSASSSRKSSAINGPYLTKPAPSRPRSATTTTTTLQNGQVLYDKIISVAEVDEGQTIKAAPKSSTLEEMPMVKAAVSAFKKRRRLKDVSSRKKAKKKTKFESVVERVMRIRAEEKKIKAKKSFKRRTQRSSSSNTTLSSSMSSSSSSSVGPRRPKRPESVAQRVLRQRKEKNISTKTPVVTPKPKSAKDAGVVTHRQPLHVALRQSASKHGPRSLMAQKIKQQAHFNAVRNYQVPALPASEDKSGSGSGETPAIKSILKMPGNKKKNGSTHVNYAFEPTEEPPKTTAATVIDKKTGRSKPALITAQVH